MVKSNSAIDIYQQGSLNCLGGMEVSHRRLPCVKIFEPLPHESNEKNQNKDSQGLYLHIYIEYQNITK